MKERECQLKLDKKDKLTDFLLYCCKEEEQHKFGGYVCSIRQWFNKRDFRADVLSLLSSALQPRLLHVRRSQTENTIKCEQNFKYFRVIREGNRGVKYQNLVKIVVLSTILFGFSLFLANFSTPVSALSLTLTIPSDPLSLNVEPTNTFTKSSASSVSVKTDAFAGYTLSIKAKSSSDLVNGSNKLTSITNNLTEDQYKAPGNTNTWGYQPSKINSSANSSFLSGPTTSPSTIEKTNAKNDTANTYNIVLGAKADSTIAQGTYKNTFIITLSANTVSYNITYHLNDGQWTGKSPQTGTTPEETVKLDANSPTRNGFEFKGWCSVSTTNDSCPSSGKTYQPGASYTLTNGSNNLELWAIWKEDKPTMQNFKCNLATGSTTTITDTRDNSTYTVAKLDDGLCWMTQNLRIIGKTIYSTDSDITASSYAIPASSTIGWNYTDNNTARAYYGGNEDYGAYYSWLAATAGTGTGSLSSGNASSSICPKGWRLPTQQEISTLTSKYNYSQAQTSVPNFGSKAWAGSCSQNGCPMNQGSFGYWWSSTALNSRSAYALDSGGGSISLFRLDGTSKGLGYSVRCVAR